MGGGGGLGAAGRRGRTGVWGGRAPGWGGWEAGAKGAWGEGEYGVQGTPRHTDLHFDPQATTFLSPPGGIYLIFFNRGMPSAGDARVLWAAHRVTGGISRLSAETCCVLSWPELSRPTPRIFALFVRIRQRQTNPAAAPRRAAPPSSPPGRFKRRPLAQGWTLVVSKVSLNFSRAL